MGWPGLGPRREQKHPALCGSASLPSDVSFLGSLWLLYPRPRRVCGYCKLPRASQNVLGLGMGRARDGGKLTRKATHLIVLSCSGHLPQEWVAQLRGQQEPSLCRGESHLIKMKHQDNQPGSEGENGWMNQQAEEDKKEIQRRRA